MHLEIIREDHGGSQELLCGAGIGDQAISGSLHKKCGCRGQGYLAGWNLEEDIGNMGKVWDCRGSLKGTCGYFAQCGFLLCHRQGWSD